MPQFSIERYSPDLTREWDKFVASSKNATFLHSRTFMSHHGDRFEDFSLMAYRNDSLYALLPAAIAGDTIISHPGLTYGGLLLNSHASTPEVLHVFSILARYLHSEGFHSLIYRAIPHIYHQMPAEEDLYALYRLGASLQCRNVSEAIYRPSGFKIWNIRRQGVQRAIRAGLVLSDIQDYRDFWAILEDNLLSYHNSYPTHSLREIEHLSSLFPNNIRLMTVRLDERVIGGTVLFITDNTVHVQYISATEEGKRLGALDFLFMSLLNSRFPDEPWFDFGTCNEDNGRILNASLAYQKEGFGARAICYDTYILPLDNVPTIPYPTLLPGQPTLI